MGKLTNAVFLLESKNMWYVAPLLNHILRDCQEQGNALGQIAEGYNGLDRAQSLESVELVSNLRSETCWHCGPGQFTSLLNIASLKWEKG